MDKPRRLQAKWNTSAIPNINIQNWLKTGLDTEQVFQSPTAAPWTVIHLFPLSHTEQSQKNMYLGK